MALMFLMLSARAEMVILLPAMLMQAKLKKNLVGAQKKLLSICVEIAGIL
jgi:hypothetical protein